MNAPGEAPRVAVTACLSFESSHPSWCATLSSNETGTLSAWRGLLRNLLERLSHNRLGITYLELWCCRGPGVGARQGYLFPADEKSRQLGVVLGQMNGPGKPGVGTASEQLLSRWGICWYGPICLEKSDS